MRRSMWVTAALAALLLAVPVAASANTAHARSHHRARHARRHARHHTGSRLIRFGTTASSSAPAAPGATTSAPAGSAPATTGTPTPAAGETAGKVVSFNEGKLTIALTAGGEVSGMVTEATRIDCPGSGESGDDDAGTPSGDARPMSAGSGDDGGEAGAGGGGGGDDEGASDDSGESDEGPACTTAALVPGAIVAEATLSVGPAGAVWSNVELAG